MATHDNICERHGKRACGQCQCDDMYDDMYDDDPELDEPLICASCSHAVGSDPFRCNCCQEPICSMCRETGFGRCDFCWEERE